MKVLVKVLFGDERPFEVSSEMLVFQLKEMVTKECNIPLAKQKLLLNGRALVDNKTLGEYNIQEGTKLNVFVTQPNQTHMNEQPSPDSLHSVLLEKLKQFWNEDEARKVADEFLRALNEKLHAMSLDDIENLATEMLDEEKAEASTACNAASLSVQPKNNSTLDAKVLSLGDSLEDLLDQ